MHFLSPIRMSKPESLSSPNTSDSLFILKRQFGSSKQSYYVIPHYISKMYNLKRQEHQLLLTDIQGNTYQVKVDLKYDPILKNEDFIEDLFGFSDIRKKYPNISESNWLMLAKGEVKPGMTTEECKLAIGEPIEIRVRTDTRFETWLYRGKILEFENGILLRAK